MGVRGLCNGLGPAAFGIMWHLLGIDMIKKTGDENTTMVNTSGSDIFLGLNSSFATTDVINPTEVIHIQRSGLASVMPGFPFLVISVFVILALICSFFLENVKFQDEENKSKAADSSNSSNSNCVPLAKESSDKSDNNANDTHVI